MDRRLNRAALWFFAGMLIVHGYVLWSVRGMVLGGYPDFTSFYGAGKMVLQGHGRALYDAGEQWNTQQEFAQRVKIRKGPLPYLRPPFEALLFVPLALLSYPNAYIVWALVNMGVAKSVVLLLRRRLRVLQEFPAWMVALLPLAFTPVFLAVMQGQDSIFLLLFYSLAYVALGQGKDFRAGCFLGLGLFKPHLIAPFILIALLQRRIKVVLGFLSVASVLAVVSAMIVGWAELIRYPGYLWFLEQHTGRGLVLPRDTPNLRGLIEGLLSGPVPNWGLFLLIGLASVGVILWAGVWHRSGDHGRIADLIFSQAVLATFLVSYHAFAYDLSMLLLPMLLVLGLRNLEARTTGERSGKVSRIGLMAPVAFLFFGPIYPLLWLRFHAMNLVAIVLLLWMWGIAREMSRPRLGQGISSAPA